MSDQARPTAPTLKKEVVATATLGEVVVNGLRLSQRIAVRTGGTPGDGLFFARLLAAAVTDKDGATLFTEEQWDIFGAEHMAEMEAVFDVALRLGGFESAASKNG